MSSNFLLPAANASTHGRISAASTGFSTSSPSSWAAASTNRLARRESASRPTCGSPNSCLELKSLECLRQHGGVGFLQAGGSHVVREQAHGLGIAWAGNFGDRGGPTQVWVVAFGVPQVVGDGRQGDLGTLRSFHRIGEHAAGEPVEVRVASTVGTEVQLGGHGDVVDGVVVPVQNRA